MLTILLFIIIVLPLIYRIYQYPKFGKYPSGKHLEKIQSSTNYKNGSFKNQSFTPIFAEKGNVFSIVKKFIFEKKERVSPIDEIPSIKTNLKNLDKNKDVLVWFGHSSYFIQIEGKKMLVDPVFSGSASPFSFMIKAFKGSNPFKADDIPEIDYLLITHDHWDHLDYETIKKLKPKIKNVICGLGTGAHLQYWGYPKSNIFEMDWHEKFSINESFTIFALPARHFSGRSYKRNQSLWVSFVFKPQPLKIFFGGDGGKDNHLAEIGEKLESIVIVI